MRSHKTVLKITPAISSLTKRPAILLLILYFSAGCATPRETGNGITFVAPAGSPPVDTIVWSPTDENKILATAGDVGKGQSEVYVLDVQTKEKIVLAKSEYGDFVSSTWSPDSKYILLLVREGTKDFEKGGLWIVKVNDGSSRYFADSGYAVWSPDGKTVATFVPEITGNDVSRIDLLLVNVDTKKEETIYSNSTSEYFWGLSWSSDGKHLVFSIGQLDSSQLYVLSLKTRQVTRLTNDDMSNRPAWSPKGNVIAYEHWPSEGSKTTLRLVSLDESCNLEIPKLEYVWSPTWSPDGVKLGYIGPDGIYFMDINMVLGRDIYQNLCR